MTVPIIARLTAVGGKLLEMEDGLRRPASAALGASRGLRRLLEDPVERLSANLGQTLERLGTPVSSEPPAPEAGDGAAASSPFNPWPQPRAAVAPSVAARAATSMARSPDFKMPAAPAFGLPRVGRVPVSPPPSAPRVRGAASPRPVSNGSQASAAALLQTPAVVGNAPVAQVSARVPAAEAPRATPAMPVVVGESGRGVDPVPPASATPTSTLSAVPVRVATPSSAGLVHAEPTPRVEPAREATPKPAGLRLAPGIGRLSSLLRANLAAPAGTPVPESTLVPVPAPVPPAPRVVPETVGAVPKAAARAVAGILPTAPEPAPGLDIPSPPRARPEPVTSTGGEPREPRAQGDLGVIDTERLADALADHLELELLRAYGTSGR